MRRTEFSCDQCFHVIVTNEMGSVLTVAVETETGEVCSAACGAAWVEKKIARVLDQLRK